MKEIKYLPQKLIREAELEELTELTELSKLATDEFPKIAKEDLFKDSSWTGKTNKEETQ